MLSKTVSDKMTGILGAWACFEPNQLDNQDKNFTSSDTSDGTGRYITYYYNDGDGAKRDLLTDYDVPGAGDYYLIAYETGKPYVTPPYDFAVGDEMVSIISIAYPINNRNGVVVGVIGVNYAIEYFDTLNDEVQLYNSGYGKLFTDSGTTIAHIDDQLINSIDLDYTTGAEAEAIKASLQAGTTYVTLNHSDVLDTDAYKAFANVPLGNSNINWVYAVIVPESEVMESTDKMIMLITLVGGIGIAVATVVIVLLSNSISRPIRAMCSIAGRIADGDLTVIVPDRFRQKKDEIGDLSNDFQLMRDGLVSTVSGITNASESLQNQVATIKNAIDLLNDRLIATSAATEELSAGMEDSGSSAKQMNVTVNEIENAAGVVSEKSVEGAGKSAEIHVRAETLDKNVTASIDKSNEMFNEIKQSLEKALEDSKAVDEINALADSILSITRQTTLLALNASIEAARAGEAGKGFSVVASEISSLADHSKDTVTQIQAITKVVMTAVNALANSATNLLNFVADNVQDDYKDMLKAADSYTSDAVYISDMTSDLSATSQQLLASVQVLLRAINEVSMAAEEGATATAIVAKQATDISSNASTVADNMNQTQSTADELALLISKFKLQ
jgi:methyl-accepting chemotaxis protein